MNYRLHTAVLLVVLCLGSFSLVAGEKLQVFSVNYPLHYFAQRIGGAHIEAHFPAPAAVDPAFWTPDIKTVGDYQRADLILLNGANYSKWVAKVSLPRLRTVDTSRGFRDQLMKGAATPTHSHGSTGEHAHQRAAFTTWLDPRLAAQQAKAIHEALSRRRPDLRQTFLDNYTKLQAELLELDKAIEQIIAKRPHQPFLASHPVYQYFIRRYNLNLQSVLWEPDADPSEADWRALQKLTSEHPARWMIWEATPKQDTVQQLRLLAVNSVVFNPCANRPEQGDYMTVMADNLLNLETAFPAFGIN
ncbi:MAG: metal ABC transporter substrate-binding protein [Amphritea sp.]